MKMQNRIAMMDRKNPYTFARSAIHRPSSDRLNKKSVLSVEFVGGPADGLWESRGIGQPLDQLVGLCREPHQSGIISIALYGLSREAAGLRYRFLRFLP